MAKKFTISFLTLFVLIVIIAFTVSFSYSEKSLNFYQNLVQESDLITLGTIVSVRLEKGILGFSGPDRPYYTTYQYITIDPETIIKGELKISPLVFRITAGFVGDPIFKENEKVIVTLKWYEDEFYGKYYAFPKLGKGKFLVNHDIGSGREIVTNKELMGENWKMNLEDFLIAIKIIDK